MVIGQQQLTGKIATRYNTIQLLRSSTLKQKSLSDKISDVGVSGLIDDTVKLSRSKRDMGKGIYYSVIFMYRAYRLVDKLGWKRGLQVVNRYLGIKRGREIVVDLIDKALEGKDIMDTIEDLRRTGLFKTNEEQFTEVPQVTEGQQVTEIPQTTEGRQVTTEISQTTERQQVTEDYSNTSLHGAAIQGNLNAAKYFVEKGADISAKTNGDDTPLYKAAFVVEMQLARDKDFEKRAQAYAGKVYSRQSGRYTNLKKVFFIAISNCILFPKKSNYISSHTIRDEETNKHDLQCLSLKH